MYALLLLTSAGLAAAETAVAPSLMQSRLRGAKTSQATEAMSPSKSFASAVMGQRYSDDDASCSAEGITPGVCALASLARLSSESSSTGKVADCDKQESRDRLERALIAEIESAAAGNHTGIDAARLQKLEEELKPIYATLPRESSPSGEGGLGYASARYLLHQHFLRQHAWYVRGLNPAGDGRKPPDDKEVLRSRVAGHLLEVMENKARQGLDLKKLAVFVATLEHLIHGDQRERLKQAWLVHDLKPEDSTDLAGLESVLEVFMAHYVYVSQKVDSGYALTLAKAREEVATISRIYGGWPQIRTFIHDQVAQKPAGSSLSFEDAAGAADAVLLLFQEVSGAMCHDMERTFQSLNGGDVGRVRLAELRAADGGDLFRESMDYLRELGAVDGSEPYVLMPNYMLGPSNCDGTTSFYDLCCPSTCEVHKGHLERAVMSATDHLSAISSVVQERLGAEVPAPMQQQLQELSKDGGQILIHGRAFADWLHKVFPRDCPRPRAADFQGMAGDIVPDANAEFQHVTDLKQDLFGGNEIPPKLRGLDNSAKRSHFE
eukprot:CAMPEP_0181429810 /NCGR_PEP_ID=MMETSP1110-20121109/17396_1 /TAXON_ID=174948 /ORGANISM="Symbiodinium sp., Strain CCMP421" /LENGTH=548 /DNA_ID=CAMNT_0023553099 /DNA_START=110 /DNA_END=1754 /DNA_ORIENTATION=+